MGANALAVDGTKKGCRGIVAQLSEIMKQSTAGTVVDAIVPDLVNRNEVVEWAQRRGYKLVSETQRGGVYVLSILKTN